MALPLTFPWRELDMRRPWSWPRAYQLGARWLGVIVGVVVWSPFGWDSWQAWGDDQVAQQALREQVQHTHLLQAETAKLQQSPHAVAIRWGDASGLTAQSASPGLRWTQQALTASQNTAILTAMQLQQIPMHLQAQGPWQAWLTWLSQWPQVAPGASLRSLVLEFEGREGVRADMNILATQHTAQVAAVHAKPMLSSGGIGGPFDVDRWAEAQQSQAERHPSYNTRVRPELRRQREPLEAIARERLHYVGHIAKGMDVQALVRVSVVDVGKASPSLSLAPIHRVHVGSYLGPNFGRVVSITSEALWLKELVLAPSGEWVSRDVSLTLYVQAP